MRDHSSGLCPEFLQGMMCCEDFLVVFCLLLLYVERSKELWYSWHGVVGPLLTVLGEERVASGTSVFGLLGQQQLFLRRGRAVHIRSDKFAWDFDATRGFPGEDIFC